MLDNGSKLLELKEKDVYFFDLDGTIYLGNKLFDGVSELLVLLRKKNKIIFL